MKCPYQSVTIHKPEQKNEYVTEYAQDIVEFGDCMGIVCPFYYISHENEKKIEHCHRVESEIRR